MVSQGQQPRSRSWEHESQRHGNFLRSTRSRSRVADTRERDALGENDDDDDDEEDDDDDEDDNDEDFLNGPTGANAYLRFGWQGSQPAITSVASQQEVTTYVEPQPSYDLQTLRGTQGNFNDEFLNGGQWGQEMENSSIFPDTLASNSFLTDLQQTGSQSNITPTGGNFGQAANFTTSPEHYPYEHVDSGTGPQAYLPAQYPNPISAGGTSANGMKYGTHEAQAGHSVDVDRAPFTSRPGPRETAKQQAHAPRKWRCSRDQMPSSPDSSGGRPDAHSAASPLAQGSLVSSPESSDGILHRVSVDAHCTSDQLGDLMRTLVGVTKTIVVKVDR